MYLLAPSVLQIYVCADEFLRLPIRLPAKGCFVERGAKAKINDRGGMKLFVAGLLSRVDGIGLGCIRALKTDC